MRTLLIPCLAGLSLAAACQGAAAAEWTLLPHPASSGYTLYTDPAAGQPRHNKYVGYVLGNAMQAWFVTDYATPHRWTIFQVLSSKELLEFDCKRGSVRMLVRRYYDSPMAQGRIVASEPEATGFTRVVPGDPEETMFQSACARMQALHHPPTAPPPAATPVAQAPVMAPLDVPAAQGVVVQPVEMPAAAPAQP
ncbi:surface-adhesin E family protein [Pseudorhodoferax sp. Leaf267]|uniref:surface-adhesin E family protein n=1 Tax=Pseudorhodoferax sp. Leaf267 TaxID=1736316 RepID=UPI0006F680AA|nr:surface-adhesin E family protein [Pseudorhodoferax sp. Leaf267]KQP20540.1 hypothetical protein ASF43_27320 [Pseudorhodoferax sp. Leaf267]